jgi:hypothetical protein
MVAFERYITVVNPEEIVISGLPLHPGQRVRVTVVVDEAGAQERGKVLRELLKATQALPQARAVTEEEIAAQVAAVRASAA